MCNSDVTTIKVWDKEHNFIINSYFNGQMGSQLLIAGDEKIKWKKLDKHHNTHVGESVEVLQKTYTI